MTATPPKVNVLDELNRQHRRNPINAAVRSTFNQQAERAIIACLMREPNIRTILDNGITPDHFSGARREAFEAIAEFIADGTPPDAATLRAALDDAGMIEVETSLQEHASAANASIYAKLLRESKAARDEQEARERLAKALSEGAPPHVLAELFADVRAAGSGIGDKNSPPPWKSLDLDAMRAARLHPRCIVENSLYADLCVVNAEGGTGKTTVQLYEAVHIALGWDLWGCRVLNPGRTLYITAEDGEEILKARLLKIMDALGLDEWQRRKVADGVNFWDVSGTLARLAELDARGNLVLTELADRIVETYRDAGLVQVIFDPAISFSPGERIVNDGEQSVVTACRRIVRGLNCCVRLIHHSGQANARNGAIDQYAGRGGTALPDGARMVTILANADRVNLQKPDGFDLQPGESGFVMSRPKLSYCPPQPNIWIRRRGWTFEYFVEMPRNAEAARDRDSDKVADFLAEELHHGRRYTARSLEDCGKLKLPRARLRAALATLEAAGRLEERALPADQRRGRKKHYLHCAKASGAIAAETPHEQPTPPPIAQDISIAPPYRETRNGAIDAVLVSPDSLHCAKQSGAITAQWRNSEESSPDTPDTPTVDMPDVAATAERLLASQRIALDALKTALVEHGTEDRGVVSVAEDQWRKAAYDGGITASDSTPDARRKAFNRARDSLVATKKVACFESRYWIPLHRTKPDKTGHCPEMSDTQTGQNRTSSFKGCPDVRVSCPDDGKAWETI